MWQTGIFVDAACRNTLNKVSPTRRSYGSKCLTGEDVGQFTRHQAHESTAYGTCPVPTLLRVEDLD